MKMQQLSLITETTKELSKWVTATYDSDGSIISAVITVGELQAELDGSAAKMLINAQRRFIDGCSCHPILEKRFIDGCFGHPILSEATSLLLIGGEDDCQLHGFEMEE